MITLYRIANNANGKSYIGQTSQTLRARFRNHIATAMTHRGCRYLASAIRKYGELAFSVEVMAQSESSIQIDALEKLWIIALDTRNTNCGYNLSVGGENGSRGTKWSAESRAKLSATMQGNKRCLGKVCSEATRRKISLSLMGHPQKPNSGSFKAGRNSHA